MLERISVCFGANKAISGAIREIRDIPLRVWTNPESEFSRLYVKFRNSDKLFPADEFAPVKKSTNKLKNFLLGAFKKLSNIAKSAFKKRIERGRYNKAHIKFEEAETLQEAIRFGKRNGLYRRMRDVESWDLAQVNELNRALTIVHNKTKGRARMPVGVLFRDELISSDGMHCAARYTNMGDRLVLSRMCPHDRISKTVFHELGHAQHGLNTDIAKLGRLQEIYNNGISNTSMTEAFLSEVELNNMIAKTFGENYASSPAEFVAEYFAQKMLGKKIPVQLKDLYDVLTSKPILNMTV